MFAGWRSNKLYRKIRGKGRIKPIYLPLCDSLCLSIHLAVTEKMPGCSNLGGTNLIKYSLACYLGCCFAIGLNLHKVIVHFTWVSCPSSTPLFKKKYFHLVQGMVTWHHTIFPILQAFFVTSAFFFQNRIKSRHWSGVGGGKEFRKREGLHTPKESLTW